jgi:hypothetical protein
MHFTIYRASATIAMLIVLAACTSGTPSTRSSGSRTSSTSTSASAVAYSACMRQHGVPNFPDPGAGGGIPKGDAHQVGVSTSAYQAAQQACQHLVPTGGSLQDQATACAFTGNCPPALVQQMLTAMRTFATCMRAHGFPKFPDPTTDSGGFPALAWSISTSGIDPHSSQYESKERECTSLGGLGGPRAVSP